MLQKGLPDEFFRIIFYGNMFFVGWVAGSRALYVEFGVRIDGWGASSVLSYQHRACGAFMMKIRGSTG